MDTISSTGGYGTFVATTSHGSIIGSAITARTIDLTSSNAGVKITDVTTSVQLLAATQDGGVVIKDASSDGNIEVETSSGNVYISIKNGGFSGTYSLSSKGSVSIEKVDGSSTSRAFASFFFENNPLFLYMSLSDRRVNGPPHMHMHTRVRAHANTQTWGRMTRICECVLHPKFTI